MITDPYAPPASEEEQFREVARLLGVALHRWHKLNQRKLVKPDHAPEQAPAVEQVPAAPEGTHP